MWRQRRNPAVVIDPPHVLAVDDDARALTELADHLRHDGFEVTAASSGRTALAAFHERWPQLVLLELALPDLRGEVVAARIKARADIPILVVSSVSSAQARTAAIQRFAEDFVVKPYDYPELLARIHRVLGRMTHRIPGQELTLGPDLQLILARRRARVGERSVSLSPIETRLLGILAAQKDRAVSTAELLARVWSHADSADPSYVWVTVRRLRQKLEPEPQRPRYLVSVPGVGYSLRGLADPA
jgi:two-component system KDP operon response regulator KdpE